MLRRTLTCLSIRQQRLTAAWRVGGCQLNAVLGPTEQIQQEHRVYVLAHCHLQQWSWNLEKHMSRVSEGNRLTVRHTDSDRRLWVMAPQETHRIHLHFIPEQTQSKKKKKKKSCSHLESEKSFPEWRGIQHMLINLFNYNLRKSKPCINAHININNSIVTPFHWGTLFVSLLLGRAWSGNLMTHTHKYTLQWRHVCMCFTFTFFFNLQYIIFHCFTSLSQRTF